jgi:hypothetical protein
VHPVQRALSLQLHGRAFATLGHDPGPILLDAAANQMVDNIAHFRPQVSSIFVYDCNTIKRSCTLPLLSGACRQCALQD